MLVVEIFPPLGQADSGEAFLVERSVVATAEEAVMTKFEDGAEGGHGAGLEVCTGHGGDGTRQLTGRRVVFATDSFNPLRLIGCGGLRNLLGKDADTVLVLKLVPRSRIAADNVVVEYTFQLPALAAGQPGQVAASIQALFLSRHGDEDQGGWKRHPAEHARASQADGHAAGVVIGARRRVPGVLVGGVARVVVPGDQIHALALCRVLSPQDRVYVSKKCRLGNTTLGLFGKGVPPDLQAPSASCRVLLKLCFDPVRSRVDALTRPQVLPHGGEGAAIVEAHEGGYRLLYVRGGNLPESVTDRRVNGSGRNRISCGSEIERGAGPGFPVGLGGVNEVHAAFLEESRTRGPNWCTAVGNPGGPGFPVGLGGSTKFMRLSLKKAAHVAPTGAPQ